MTSKTTIRETKLLCNWILLSYRACDNKPQSYILLLTKERYSKRKRTRNLSQSHAVFLHFVIAQCIDG